MNDCLFCKIATKEIPANIVYEDADLMVFNDINPKRPIHWLVIPRAHLSSLNDLNDASLASKLLSMIPKLAKQYKFSNNGYRVVINTRSHGGQEVDHLHIHVLAGAPAGPMVES